MTSIIQRAISEIKWSIPLEILQLAFMPANGTRPTAMNLDSRIRAEVIDPRVLEDCNIVAGVQMDIPLRGLHPETVPLPGGSPYSWALIYRIPKTLTQNRTITSVLWLANTIAPISGTYTYASYNGSALANAAMGVMQSQAPIPSMSTARVDLIAENTIMVYDSGEQWPFEASLRCKVEHDKELSLVPPGGYRIFCKACELAAKAYIYNTCTVRLNQGELYMGQEISTVKSIIDGYADANEQYRDHLDNLREMLMYADPVSSRDAMRWIISAGV